jgi:hypothetical protein
MEEKEDCCVISLLIYYARSLRNAVIHLAMSGTNKTLSRLSCIL